MARRALLLLAVGLLVVAAPAAAEKPQGVKGTWKIVSADKEGTPIQQYIGVVVTFEDNKYSAKLPSGETHDADIKVDTTKTPWTIDMTPHYGPNDGKLFKGICKVEGDTMTMCRGDAEKERPKEFTDAAGSGCTLIVFKREKP
jgi:uncharacterized protein (TIGR03067 family)